MHLPQPVRTVQGIEGENRTKCSLQSLLVRLNLCTNESPGVMHGWRCICSGCAGVQSHMAANARFPRAPLDIRNAPPSPSASIRSGTTSIRAQQGEIFAAESLDSLLRKCRMQWAITCMQKGLRKHQECTLFMRSAKNLPARLDPLCILWHVRYVLK